MSGLSKVVQVAIVKTARACDGCIRKRARWFCAADDAFLCQSCDSKVHSANPVSRRHERVRLKTASFRSQIDDDGNEHENVTPRVTRSVPSWHSRKARTPRGELQNSSVFKSPISENHDDIVRNLFYLVPEVMSDDATPFNEQLLYGRVPILADSASENNKAAGSFGANEVKGFVGNFYNEVGFVPSEMDLEEFAADVESLLGKGLDDDESFGIDGLGLGLGLMMEVDGSSSMMEDTTSMRCSSGRVMIKDEDEEKEKEKEDIEMANEEVPDLGFDYNEEDREEIDEKVEVVLDDEEKRSFSKKRKILLRLDYESLLSAWDGSSPWAAGARPDIDPNDHCWPICMTTCQIESHQLQLADHAACLNGRIGLSGDGGREARVSRYREKRRTRLFSKKIRYEVRKLNAEKRPRMKGRFVKRPLSPLSNVSLFS